MNKGFRCNQNNNRIHQYNKSKLIKKEKIIVEEDKIRITRKEKNSNVEVDEMNKIYKQQMRKYYSSLSNKKPKEKDKRKEKYYDFDDF